ncbi:hypothetical protein [Roseovarius mucosus]|uniref:hypothetical protein n=1 Tax=Roseovarius mucosus TaxID=215743 RepID=UPI0035CF2E17
MPAARSEAEAEIRDAVVAKLRRTRPVARIIHEINMGGGINRADVMAVSPAEIITVEIKSEKDKLDRLPAQIATMRKCSHITIAALHRKFIPDIDSVHAPRLDFIPFGTLTWWYPSAQDMAEAHHPAFQWKDPDVRDSMMKPLPHAALDLLWRAELLDLCAELSVSADRKADMVRLKTALRWQATGGALTKGICRALRRRDPCAEADPPIED